MTIHSLPLARRERTMRLAREVAAVAEDPRVFRPRLARARAALAGTMTSPEELDAKARELKQQAGAPVADDGEIDVQFTPAGKPAKIPAAPKFSALVSWLQANHPGAADLTHAQLGEMATRIIEALDAVGVQLDRRRPVLLLSAWPGGNDRECMLAALASEAPALRRVKLEHRVTLASDYLAAFRGRIL